MAQKQRRAMDGAPSFGGGLTKSNRRFFGSAEVCASLRMTGQFGNEEGLADEQWQQFWAVTDDFEQ
jgi:hypothetical protein